MASCSRQEVNIQKGDSCPITYVDVLNKDNLLYDTDTIFKPETVINVFLNDFKKIVCVQSQ